MAELNRVQDAITIRQNQAEIGKERDILVHYASKKEENVYYGRTKQFRLVRIASGRNLTGQSVRARITDANKTALVGELV